VSDEHAFRSRFGASPDTRIVVPGRVNLIGDHVDYCGLPVLPAAIQRRVELHVRARDDRTVRIASGAAPPREFAIAEPLPPFAPGDWGNYAKAAISELTRDIGEVHGFDALFDSDLPRSAGLSSSSAIVVATALAFLHVNHTRIDPLDLASRLARAERYVGTHGGGMDQAVLLLAKKRHALRIDFDPLRVCPRQVPDAWTFVVAHSLVEASKSDTARDAYNSRPREAEAARAAVARSLGAPDASFRDLADRFTVDELLDAARRVDTVHRPRFTHVVTEADRVERAARALELDEPETFGRLMSESHESLRTQCEVSHPRLDRLVAICLRSGAHGARLTGAGFGGCVLALTNPSQRDGLIAGLTDEFYGPLGVDGRLVDDRLFVAVPSQGAFIVE
jgi:galactokinase